MLFSALILVVGGVGGTVIKILFDIRKEMKVVVVKSVQHDERISNHAKKLDEHHERLNDHGKRLGNLEKRQASRN